MWIQYQIDPDNPNRMMPTGRGLPGNMRIELLGPSSYVISGVRYVWVWEEQ